MDESILQAAYDTAFKNVQQAPTDGLIKYMMDTCPSCAGNDTICPIREAIIKTIMNRIDGGDMD